MRACRLAWERQRRPRASRLAGCPQLRAVVQGWLDEDYSPEQITGRLAVDYPDDDSMRISPETIYQAIYVHPRGELRKELTARDCCENAQARLSHSAGARSGRRCFLADSIACRV